MDGWMDILGGKGGFRGGEVDGWMNKWVYGCGCGCGICVGWEVERTHTRISVSHLLRQFMADQWANE